MDAFPARPDTVTTLQSRTSWVVEVGGRRVAWTRVRETRAVGSPAAWAPPASRRSRWPLAIGTFASVSAFGLVVAGALASPRVSEPASYRVEIAVPEATSRAARPAHLVAGRASPRRAIPRTAARDLAPQDGLDPDDERHVAVAMRTGGFQEWRDELGQPRFLTAGTASGAAGRRCRDLTLLVRLAGGMSHVRALRRCTSGPVDVAADPAVTDNEAVPLPAAPPDQTRD